MRDQFVQQLHDKIVEPCQTVENMILSELNLTSSVACKHDARSERSVTYKVKKSQDQINFTNTGVNL